MPQQGYVSIEDDIRQEADKQGVPVDLALAVAEQESGFNPTAVNPKSGATGTFQFLPSVAKGRGFDPTDQRANVIEGVKYLRELLDKHQGDPEAVLKEYGGVKTDTTYVPGVLGRRDKFADSVPPPPKPPPPDTSQQFVGPPAPPDKTWGQRAYDALATNPRIAFEGVKEFGKETANRSSRMMDMVMQKLGVPGDRPVPFPEEPKSVAGKIGRAVEPMAEFGVASALTGGLGGGALVQAPAQAGVAHMLSKSQGASDTGANVNAALSAAGPVLTSVMEAGVPKILASAQEKLAKVYSRGLENKGPMVDYALKTGEAGTKSVENSLQIVRQAAADTLDLPIQASWGKWMTTLAKNAETKGQTLGKALEGPLGDVEIPKAPIVKALDDLIDTGTRHFAEMPEGDFRNITFAEPLQKELSALKDQLSQYGEHITARNLTDIKRTWDAAVYDLAMSGKVGVPSDVLVSSAKEKAMNTGANAVRAVLQQEAPDLAALNEAATHAFRLQNLVEKLYKVSPGMGTKSQLATHAAGTFGGGTIGTALGGHWIIGSTIGSAASSALIQAMKSPIWQTANPAVKNALAKAIVAKQPEAVMAIVRPFLQGSVAQATATK